MAALRTFCLAAVASLSVAAITANAASYPDRTVRFIVGFEPGGGTDTLARLVAQKLTDKWKQPVVVENRAGADGSIAADVIAHAPPDGYQVAWITNAHTITPSEYKLNYDPVRSFTPITEPASVPVVLLVNPSLGVDNLKDFIALAKSKPGGLTFGSSGTGTAPYLAMALLMHMTGINMVSVTYKGTAPALVGLLGGETQVMFGAVPTAMAQVKAGKLKALAVSSTVRVPVMPDVPTVAEAANLPGFEASGWYGVLAPAGIPSDVSTKLHDDIVEALKLPDIQKTMFDQGFVSVADSSDHFTHTISDDIKRWSELLKSAPK